MTFLAYAFISMLPVNYRLSSRYRGANWEYQGDVFSAEAKSRVETICFCVIFSLGFWQQVSKLCSFTRRSREEDLE